MRTPLTVGLLLLLTLASGCGRATDPGGSGTGGSGTGGSGSGGGEGFPVTITRTGGLAGFDDSVSVAADGRVTGRTKAGPVDCSIGGERASSLHDAAQNPDGVGNPGRGGSDLMTVTVATGGRTVQLGEAAGADALSRAVTELLDDLQSESGARTLCR